MKAYVKNIVREIRSSFGRFMSIFAIVALGTGFLAGLAATSPDMQDSVDRYYDRSRMHDLEVMSTLGLTDADVDALRQVEGIGTACPVYRTDVLLDLSADRSLAARLISFPEEGEVWLDQFTILSGEMPRNANECAVVDLKNNDVKPKVGSTLRISDDSDTEGILRERTFTVTAVVDSSRYFSMEKESTALGSGTVGVVLYLPEDAFDMDCYTGILLSAQGSEELQTFSGAYDACIEAVQSRIEAISDDRCQERLAELKADPQQEIDDGWEEYHSQKADAEAELSDAKEQLDAARVQLDAQKEQVDAQVQMLMQSGQTEQAQYLEDSLAEAEAEYAENLKAYETSRERAAQELEDAEQQLLDAQAELDDLELPEWYIQTRDDNLSYASFDGNSQKVAAIAVVFPVFFFMVAALVALTTMTRMVEEQRVQIGTLKALGYGGAAIAMKYLLYAGTATLAGSALGLTVGLQLFPRVLWNCYGMMYNLPEFYAPFRWNYALLVFGAVLLCILLSAWGACRMSLRECAASLMLPKTPKAGKRVFLERITPIWKRMRFTHKVTVRNLFRYKKRFFMTIIGIGGCTALLLTGFGLSDSINAVVDKQYEIICHYDMMILCRSGEAAQDEEILSKIGTSGTAALARQESCEISAGEETLEAYLFVPQSPDELSAYITLQERRSEKPLSLGDTGVVLTEKAAETMGIAPGNTMTLENRDGDRVSLTVDGITENYTYSYVYMAPQLYEEVFGEAPEFQLLLVDLPGMEEDGMNTLARELLSLDEVNMLTQVSSIRSSFSRVVASIDYIVLVLIVCAGLLAFVVLYNLMNINITERERELATIKVLGFYEGEVGAYVYRETVLLSLFGTALGLFLGIFLHAFVVRTAEVNTAMFGREIAPLSFVYAAALTLVFTLLVCLVMFPKLRRINMVESLKSVE